MSTKPKGLPKTNEFLSRSLFPVKRVDYLRPYLLDESDDGNLSYMCWHPGDEYGNCTIMRQKTEAGANNNTITTTEVAVGPWENRRIAEGEEGALQWFPINGSETAYVDFKK